LLIPAVVLMLVLVPPFGQPEAIADLVVYSWGPIEGSGRYTNTFGTPVDYFTTGNASLTIGFDPDAFLLSGSYLTFSTGSPAYTVQAEYEFGFSDFFGLFEISAIYENGGMVIALFDGSPGPLNSQGDPESLDSLLGCLVSVEVTPLYHGDELSFSGQLVPEPPSLLTLTLAISGISLVHLVLRAKRPRVIGRAVRV
jgi:hypothetical protein